MTFWERQNYGGSKKVSGCQGLRGGGRQSYDEVEHRLFRTVRLLCMMDTCTKSRVNPNANCGLWVICVVGSSVMTNVPLLWRELIIGGGCIMPVSGQGPYEKSLYLPLNFPVNLKLL